MITAIRSKDEKQYEFYTYDPVGRDRIIPIWAPTRNAAIIKFDSMYGACTTVDWIKEVD